MLKDNPDSVIHFGAGHSVFEDTDAFNRAQKCLEPYANVVLLLPSPDLDESAKILRDRQRLYVDGIELNRYIITHPSGRELSTAIVYTKDRTPEETRDEILDLVGR